MRLRLFLLFANLWSLANLANLANLATMNFSEKLAAAVRKKDSCLMLGLDPNPEKMPAHFSKDAQGAYEFCSAIMKACSERICSVKIQMAYFEVFGSKGIEAVEKLLAEAKKLDLITLIDGKRNDIGSTAQAYADAYLKPGSPLEADSVTVNPLLGSDGVMPFVKACEDYNKGIFILTRTSNPSSSEFQGREDLSVAIAEKIEEWNITTQSQENLLSSVGAVVGATHGEMMKFFREELQNSWILCPGVGAQGGSMEDCLNIRKNGLGILIPIAREVLYASNGKDFAEASKLKMGEYWLAQKYFS